MNTIHTTFNRIKTGYTVIGATGQTDEKGDISAIILNRGGKPYRKDLYNELLKFDIKEIISIETGARDHYELEKESNETDGLKFLIFQTETSIGELINTGIAESSGEFVLVLWDDMEINSKNISLRVFNKIKEDKRLCTAPVLKKESGDVIPGYMTPVFDKELLKVVPLSESKTSKTLYPDMYMGIYHKESFIYLGGFDIDIKNSYWQKLDFGLRAHMWGEDIKVHNSLLFTTVNNYESIEDITPDKYYRLYSLKNLSVVIKNDKGYLPRKRFLSYYEKSGTTFFDALRTFRSVRQWIYINRFRFKKSAPDITKSWEE